MPDNDIGKMDDGGWYWVSKPVIQEYIPKIGFLSACVYHLLASMVDALFIDHIRRLRENLGAREAKALSKPVERKKENAS